MQINKQDFFIGRALFYISLEITGLAKQGGKYKFDYPRVYSLSFLNYEPNPEDAKRDIVQHIGLFRHKAFQEALSSYSHSFGHLEKVQEEALPLQNYLRPVALPVQQFA
jgi:hypothetical protein